MALIERLFARRSRQGEARYPDGERCYAIGDVHGRNDLLDVLLQQIREDAEDHDGPRRVVYLGDYIDRGPGSRQVVERLLSEPLDGFESVFLKGNHEQALLDFLEHPLETAAWLTFGGRETLASYGIDVPLYPGVEGLLALAQSLTEHLPVEHRAFFEQGLTHWHAGDYYFVHAGIRPGVALDRQHRDDQLWIREEFTSSRLDHGAVVVHGHVITTEPQVRDNRIGIDTGAFHSGVLTCLVLEGNQRRFLSTTESAP